ncbi:MAG TPA: HAMP domain-containing sensor histidine kinase [Candidatus Baltobacteraceae bacterium]|nr:HAMP domain-containing sensor histidine kinase [Candidatus Baltobacteraceae bacterium]
MPTEPTFRNFARRITRGYVILAVALIALVAGASSAFFIVGFATTFNQNIDAAQTRVQQRVNEYAARGESLAQIAPNVLAEEPNAHSRMLVLDSQHRVIAGASAQLNDSERAIAGLLFLRPRFVGVPHGGTIVLEPDVGDFTHALVHYWERIVPIGVLAVLIAWLAGRAITGRALRPLREVNDALGSIAQGDFTPKLLIESDSSLHELTQTYNEVAQRLNVATYERRRQEAELRQFIADAGHELRTPLTIFMGYLDALRSGVVQDGESVGRVHETMLDESRKMRAIIEKLILLARLEREVPPVTDRIDLNSIAARAVDALRPLAGERLRFAADGDAAVLGDDTELYEAVKNVVENAVRYAPASPVDVRVGRDGATAVLQVADRGPGMPTIDVEHAFDRFYRGSSHGEIDGSGLGLAIAKRAVERMGGSIALDSRVDAGTTVTMRFPVEA